MYPFFKDIVLTFIHSLPVGALLSFMLALLIKLLKKKSTKGILKDFLSSLKKRDYRIILYFSTYFYILIYRTLLCRKAIYEPFSNIMGGWTIAVSKYNVVNYEVFGNIGLFVIFAVLMVFSFRKHFCSNYRIILLSGLYSFLMSAFIEINQIIFSVGTFQFSDLFYNTLGGIIGGLLIILIRKIIYTLDAVVKWR